MFKCSSLIVPEILERFRSSWVRPIECVSNWANIRLESC